MDWTDRSIGDLLLEPTKIYVKSVIELTEKLTVKVKCLPLKYLLSCSVLLRHILAQSAVCPIVE